MRKLAYVFLATIGFAVSASGSVGKTEECAQIRRACEKAGFFEGGSGEGKGLWLDCVETILNVNTTKNAVLPIPKVDPQIVATCAKNHPKFATSHGGPY